MTDAEARYGKITAEDYWLKDTPLSWTLPMCLQSRHAFPELRSMANERRQPTR